MASALTRFLSPGAGPFAQFVKYGAIGVASTAVQCGVFYALAATAWPCLGPDDWAVRLCGLPSAEVTDAVRAGRAAAATAVGFTAANVFCWLMNRAFVFRAGKYAWPVEFALFFLTAAGATVLALGIQSGLIRWCGLMTSAAVFVEIAVSFCVNYAVRKFFIFKG